MEHWRTLRAECIILPPSPPAQPAADPPDDDGMLPVPPEALKPPLDPEFERLGLQQAPPDPFETERLRRHRLQRAQAEPWDALPLPDVALIRRRMRFTQVEFAHIFGFPVATLRHWEKGDRHPSGAALVLLNVIARHPRFVLQSVARYRMFRTEQRIKAWRPPGEA